MFGRFEKLVSPYPDGAVEALPQAFFPFLWACARGARRYIASMTLLTACIGVFEALLFSMLGRVVDWLAKVQPAKLWSEQRLHLLLLAAILLGSVAMIALQSLLKQQALAGQTASRHAAIALELSSAICWLRSPAELLSRRVRRDASRPRSCRLRSPCAIRG